MITRRQFLRRGALWVPSLAIARATLAQEQYLQNRRKAFRSQWTPLSVDGCVLWLDATKIVGLADGDYVSTWTDASPGSNTVAQTGADTTKPTYESDVGSLKNGHPVVRFAGGDWLEKGANSIFRNVAGATGFAVFVRNTTNESERIYQVHKNLSGIARFCLSAYLSSSKDHEFSTRRLDADSVVTIGSAGSDFALGTWYIITCTADYAAGTRDIRRNGASIDSVSGLDTGNTSDTDSAGLQIGSSTTAGANTMKGDIGEIILYSSALSSASISVVESYLNTKWAVY